MIISKMKSTKQQCLLFLYHIFGYLALTFIFCFLFFVANASIYGFHMQRLLLLIIIYVQILFYFFIIQVFQYWEIRSMVVVVAVAMVINMVKQWDFPGNISNFAFKFSLSFWILFFYNFNPSRQKLFIALNKQTLVIQKPWMSGMVHHLMNDN